MDFEQLINHITPDIHQRLRRAIEIGKWPDGRLLSEEQKEITMQALITYENKHLKDTSQRVGYIDRGHKEQGEACGDTDTPKTTTALKWS